MKRSEFVPGVLFHMPGRNRYHVYRVVERSESLSLIEHAGMIIVDQFRPALEREDWHFEVTSKGIRFWSVIDTVYLTSKVIPFDDLTVVSLPATNPISI